MRECLCGVRRWWLVNEKDRFPSSPEPLLSSFCFCPSTLLWSEHFLPSSLRHSTSGWMVRRRHGRHFLLHCPQWLSRWVKTKPGKPYGRKSAHFIVFLPSSFMSVCLRACVCVCARAFWNVGHSCRVMSALRSRHCVWRSLVGSLWGLL